MYEVQTNFKCYSCWNIYFYDERIRLLVNKEKSCIKLKKNTDKRSQSTKKTAFFVWVILPIIFV